MCWESLAAGSMRAPQVHMLHAPRSRSALGDASGLSGRFGPDVWPPRWATTQRQLPSRRLRRNLRFRLRLRLRLG